MTTGQKTKRKWGGARGPGGSRAGGSRRASNESSTEHPHRAETTAWRPFGRGDRRHPANGRRGCNDRSMPSFRTLASGLSPASSAPRRGERRNPDRTDLPIGRNPVEGVPGSTRSDIDYVVPWQRISFHPGSRRLRSGWRSARFRAFTSSRARLSQEIRSPDRSSPFAKARRRVRGPRREMPALREVSADASSRRCAPKIVGPTRLPRRRRDQRREQLRR